MKKIVLQLFIAFFIVTNVFAQKATNISGKVINSQGIKKVYLESVITQKDLDSSDISKSGTFNIKAKLVKTDFYKLRFSKEHYLLLVLEPGETVNVNINISNMYGPKISGSKNSELIYNTFGKMRDFDEEMKRITQQQEQKKKDYLRKFILDNVNSLSSLFFIESLSIEEDLEVYKKLDASLSKLYPDNHMVVSLHKKVKSLNSLDVGNLAPEIDLPGVDGKKIKLSSLKGKYVLIDFWAAWCGPCRRESPRMVSIYNKFNKKGFEIYSVSLDKDKDSWLKAIKKDGLGSWPHVSDLKYWNSIAAKEYGVDAIPYTILLDKKGLIIAKGLRGDKLSQKLEEIFR